MCCRDETPRAEVVAFASGRAAVCRKTAEEAEDHVVKVSLLSSALLWEYLILLCRQSGVSRVLIGLLEFLQCFFCV